MNTINIACASDNNYAQHLGVMIYSLLSNTTNTNEFKFYLADGGINESNLSKFNEISQKFKCEFEFIKPNIEYFKNLKIYESYGLATYFRFFLIDNINVDKVLFLDCDMIVEDDVRNLYDTELDSNIIGAVPDILCPEKHIDLITKKSYFNAGLMLIDVAKWKQNNISEKCVRFHLECEHLVEYADQDSLNYVLQDSWKKLPLKWNVLSKTKLALYNLTSTNRQIDNKNLIKDLAFNPSIIHYANRLFKPWFWLDPSPYKSNYIYNLRISPWKAADFPDKSFSGILYRLRYYLSFLFRYFIRFTKK
jgi:lipopolysaccharide biosynthesis glycosyltransferase